MFEYFGQCLWDVRSLFCVFEMSFWDWKTWSVILKHYDIVGEKTSKDKGGKDWSARRVGKQQQVTALNLTHNQKRFKYAQCKPKQKYEGQRCTEKGTMLRRTNLQTTKAKRRPQSLKWYIEPLQRRDFKETRRQRWHGLSEVAINAKPDSRWYCMGGRCKDQGSNHHSGKLHGWQAQRPGIWQSIRFTAPVAGAHTNIFKINLVNCSEGGRKDQQFENQFGQLHGWQAQRTRMQLDPTITITLVNCTGGRQTRDPTINPLNSTGGRRRHHHFQNQSGQLQGGRRRSKSFDKRSRKLHGGRRRD